MPRWSPDGRSIAFFALDPNGKAAIFTVPQDGGTPQRLLPDEAANQTDPNWSPDGSKVIFSGGSGNPSSTIRIQPTRETSVGWSSPGMASACISLIPVEMAPSNGST